jgi:hypothetical protein
MPIETDANGRRWLQGINARTGEQFRVKIPRTKEEKRAYRKAKRTSKQSGLAHVAILANRSAEIVAKAAQRRADPTDYMSKIMSLPFGASVDEGE